MSLEVFVDKQQLDKVRGCSGSLCFKRCYHAYSRGYALLAGHQG